MAQFTTDREFVITQSTGASIIPSTSYTISPDPLSMSKPISEDQNGDVGYFEHWLAKKGSKIQVFKKILEIDTGVRMDKSKTTGTISVRNGGRILMSAHSGYSTGPDREKNCLDTAKWNHLALNHIAKQVGFKFPVNIRDNAGGPLLEEHRGRAHAGHVEILLASWFVVDTVRTALNLVDKPEKWLITKLKHLRNVDLGDHRAAFISIDSEPCRTCLQYLNRLSQYTGILFMVPGSRGIGPVQVRVGGQRREDVVQEVFADSEDEDEEEQEQLQTDGEGAPFHVVPQDSESLEPATPAQRINPRRPASYWRREPWTPENPEKLLSSYKKKTPVYKFPGYDTASPLDLMTPNIRQNRDAGLPNTHPSTIQYRNASISGTSQNAEVADDVVMEDGTSFWEDLGDGLMIRFSNDVGEDHDRDPVKHELTPPSEASSGQLSSRKRLNAGHSHGQKYAQAAYQTFQESIEFDEMEREVVRRPRLGDTPPRRYNLEPTRTPRPTWRRAVNAQRDSGLSRFHDFHHRPPNIGDESVLTSRYSILRSNRRRF
ncbi:hypothetical protein F5Y10DRAFT_289612 [Nemania abortiva]|nr:hypothetical protein F5Y10DRAFT_289612 [Nemania abortiva]